MIMPQKSSHSVLDDEAAWPKGVEGCKRKRVPLVLSGQTTPSSCLAARPDAQLGLVSYWWQPISLLTFQSGAFALTESFEQQILDIPQRQREPHVHHNRKTDNFWRRIEIAKRVIGLAHPSRLAPPLPLSQLTWTVPFNRPISDRSLDAQTRTQPDSSISK